MAKPMTKEDALRHILWEYRRVNGSKTGYRKSVKALAALGFTEEGSQEFLRELGYIDADGKPYERYT